jgi:hypothetical protein
MESVALLASFGLVAGLVWLLTILASCLFFTASACATGYTGMMLASVASGPLAPVLAAIMLVIAVYFANEALKAGKVARGRVLAPFKGVAA